MSLAACAALPFTKSERFRGGATLTNSNPRHTGKDLAIQLSFRRAGDSTAFEFVRIRYKLE